jgi:hypothetical protein
MIYQQLYGVTDMLVYTAKMSKKKGIIFILLLGVVLCAIIICASLRDGKTAVSSSALSAVVKNEEQRITYLENLGWDVGNLIEEQTIVIPREFDDVYNEYNEIQKEQGFDLSQYGGMEAKRYTYEILNYPESDVPVVADIIVFRNEIIAGDVQSTSLDGFMEGIEFPK